MIDLLHGTQHCFVMRRYQTCIYQDHWVKGRSTYKGFGSWNAAEPCHIVLMRVFFIAPILSPPSVSSSWPWNRTNCQVDGIYHNGQTLFCLFLITTLTSFHSYCFWFGYFWNNARWRLTTSGCLFLATDLVTGFGGYSRCSCIQIVSRFCELFYVFFHRWRR